MKKILRFQLKDLSYSYLVYALVMMLLAGIPVFISFAYDGASININGNGFSGGIFSLVVGIAIYKEHFQMAIQNSISRKCYFQSVLCVMVITGCVCTLVDLLSFFLGLRLGGSLSESSSVNAVDVWRMCYPGFFERAGGAGAAVSFLLSVFVAFLLFAIGTMIAGGYCRMAKRYRTFYCVALPVFSFGVLPVIGAYFHKQLFKLADSFMDIMGMTSDNPFLGLLVMAVTGLILLFLSYRLLRRTELN